MSADTDQVVQSSQGVARALAEAPEKLRNEIMILRNRFVQRPFSYGVGHYPPFSKLESGNARGPIADFIDLIARDVINTRPLRVLMTDYTKYTQKIETHEIYTIATPIYPWREMTFSLVPFVFIDVGFLLYKKSKILNSSSLVHFAGIIDGVTRNLSSIDNTIHRNRMHHERRRAVGSVLQMLGAQNVNVTKDFIESDLFRFIYAAPNLIVAPDPVTAFMERTAAGDDCPFLLDGLSLNLVREQLGQKSEDYKAFPLLGNPVTMPGGLVFYPDEEALISVFTYFLQKLGIQERSDLHQSDLQNAFTLIPKTRIRQCLQSADYAGQNWDRLAIFEPAEWFTMVDSTPIDKPIFWRSGSLTLDAGQNEIVDSTALLTESIVHYDGIVTEIDWQGRGTHASVLFSDLKDASITFTRKIPRAKLEVIDALWEGARVRNSITERGALSVAELTCLPIRPEDLEPPIVSGDYPALNGGGK